MISTCRACGFRGDMARGQGKLCPPCSSAYQKSYRAANKERLAEYWRKKNLSDRQDAEFVASERKRGREYWQKLRHEVIMAYGGYKCSCCGETEPRFLSVDHVFNDGAKHRRELGYKGNGKGGSSRTLKWLKDHGFPSGFQVLCMNCNFGKARNGGVCPHKTPQANRVKTGEAQTG